MKKKIELIESNNMLPACRRVAGGGAAIYKMA